MNITFVCHITESTGGVYRFWTSRLGTLKIWLRFLFCLPLIVSIIIQVSVLSSGWVPTLCHVAVMLYVLKKDYVFLLICIFNVMFIYFYCYVYVFLLLRMFFFAYSVFIVPTGTLRLPWLRFLHAFSSVVRQTPGYNSQRRGTACTLPS